MDEKHIDYRALKEAGRILRKGGLVAFATETVYGLGANALDEKAVQKIFRAKGRPSDNPLIVHISEKKQLGLLAKNIPPKARALVKRFWPGPLTIVVPKKPILSAVVTGGLDTVAIRMPSHKVARALLRAAGVPIAAPSANKSGRPSTTRSSHVLADLDQQIDGIVDAGPADHGIESTIVRAKGSRLELLRPGALPIEALEKAGFVIDVHPRLWAHPATALAPGMKYRHYAPRARVSLFTRKQPAKKIQRLIRAEQKKGRIVALLWMRDEPLKGVLTKRYSDERQMAFELFDDFRHLDEWKVHHIFLEQVPQTGLGLGIMNRVQKAATPSNQVHKPFSKQLPKKRT